MINKISLGLLGALSAFLLVFVVAGLSSAPEWSGSKTEVYNAPVDSVWFLLKDTYRYNSQRHEVAKTQMLVEENTYRKWKEHTNIFGDILLETAHETPMKELEIRMIESGFGMKGTWTFLLTPEHGKTKVTITENSVTDGLVMRSILTLVGRNGNLKLQTNVLKRHVQKMNINS